MDCVSKHGLYWWIRLVILLIRQQKTESVLQIARLLGVWLVRKYAKTIDRTLTKIRRAWMLKRHSFKLKTEKQQANLPGKGWINTSWQMILVEVARATSHPVVMLCSYDNGQMADDRNVTFPNSPWGSIYQFIKFKLIFSRLSTFTQLFYSTFISYLRENNNRISQWNIFLNFDVVWTLISMKSQSFPETAPHTCCLKTPTIPKVTSLTIEN